MPLRVAWMPEGLCRSSVVQQSTSGFEFPGMNLYSRMPQYIELKATRNESSQSSTLDINFFKYFIPGIKTNCISSCILYNFLL